MMPERSILADFGHSLQVGLSFGLVSGVITCLGLVVGLAFGTHSQVAVIGGIVTIAAADSCSDALGIHISEEAENVHTTAEVWISTLSTLVSKLVMSLSFLVPVLLLELGTAVWASLAWGLAAVAGLTLYIARSQPRRERLLAVAEHVGVTLIVVVASAGLGLWVSTTFG